METSRARLLAGAAVAAVGRPQQQQQFSGYRRHAQQQQREADDKGGAGAGGDKGGAGDGGAGGGGDKGGAGDGGAGGGGDKGGAGDGGAGGGKAKSLLEMGADDAGGAGDGGDKGGAAYHPQGLSDDLKGGSDKETIDKLLARTTGLREALARKGGAPPETPEGYDLSAAAKEFGDAADEKNPVNAPVFKVLRAAAQAAGIGQEAFAKLVGESLKGMKDGGLLDGTGGAQTSMEASGAAELDKMAKMYGGKEQALKIVKDENQYLANLRTQGIITAEDQAELMIALGTADGVRAFQKLRAHWTGHELPVLEDTSVSRETVAQVKQRFADPRYQTDPAFRAETERLLGEAQRGEKAA